MRAEDWSEKAAWMRTVGATDAAWSTDGALVHLRLGPEPAADEDETQQTTPPANAEQRARDERRRVAALATGGPVRRLNEAG